MPFDPVSHCVGVSSRKQASARCRGETTRRLLSARISGVFRGRSFAISHRIGLRWQWGFEERRVL